MPNVPAQMPVAVELDDLKAADVADVEITLVVEGEVRGPREPLLRLPLVADQPHDLAALPVEDPHGAVARVGDVEPVLVGDGVDGPPRARVAVRPHVGVVAVEGDDLAARRIGDVLRSVRRDRDVHGLLERAGADRSSVALEGLRLQVEDDDAGVRVADVDLPVEERDAVRLVDLELLLLAHDELAETGLLLDVLRAGEGSEVLDARRLRRGREEDGWCFLRARGGAGGEDGGGGQRETPAGGEGEGGFAAHAESPERDAAAPRRTAFERILGHGPAERRVRVARPEEKRRGRRTGPVWKHLGRVTLRVSWRPDRSPCCGRSGRDGCSRRSATGGFHPCCPCCGPSGTSRTPPRR